MNKITKKIICGVISVSSIAASVSVFAEDYYNAIEEVNQISSFMNNGMYLEVIRDANNTIAWHNLSPDDISLLQEYIDEAETMYNDYISGASAYYDASAEIYQIRSFIDSGMYIEAMQSVEQTLSWHNLSPSDINILNELYTDAQTKYQSYLKGSEIKSYQGIWYSDDGMYQLNVTEINDSYAVCKPERTRGKAAEYNLDKAYFTYSNFAETEGTIYYPYYGTSSVSHFGFEFKDNIIRMYVDGEIVYLYR